MRRATPSYRDLIPASARASTAARGASRKQDTKPEIALRRLLWRAGLRYRVAVFSLPGKPDIVFHAKRVAVFCDGDFWHGKNWKSRRAKLKRGTNAQYWIKKIESNVMRDRENETKLRADGWRVFRFWETDILKAPEQIAETLIRTLVDRHRRSRRTGGVASKA